MGTKLGLFFVPFTPPKDALSLQHKIKAGAHQSKNCKVAMNYLKFKQVEIMLGTETRKPALTNLNRDVNLGHAMKIKSFMEEWKYNPNEPIQVMNGEDIIKFGSISLFDICKNEIRSEDAKDYFAIVDGQHRTYAVSMYNDWAKETGKENISVPAIKVDLGNRSLAQYINQLNITKKDWDTPDYIRSASNLDPENEFLKRYSELIRTEKNPNGYPFTTLNHIFCGEGRKISKSDFCLLCAGEKEKGQNIKRPIVPSSQCLKNGNRFISICREKGFEDKDIAKRYLIKEFNDIRNEEADIQKAFEIFEAIDDNDKGAMFNSNKKIDEELIHKQIGMIKQRVWKESETSNENND